MNGAMLDGSDGSGHTWTESEHANLQLTHRGVELNQYIFVGELISPIPKS